MVSTSTVYLYQTNQIPYDTIIIPKKLVKKLKIDTQFISVVVGSKQVLVNVLPSSKTSKLGIHPLLAQKLHLTTTIFDTIPLHIKYSKTHSLLRLGPVVTVIVNPLKEGVQFPFGNITTYAIELSEVAKKKGILLYFITPDELNTDFTHLDGWFYSTEWKKEQFPFPNIVYNRIATRSVEQSDSVQYFFNKLNKMNIPYFNSRFFNKDEVFKALKNEESVSHLLPHSELLHQLDQIEHMAKRYDTIYIKPIHGRLGNGIYRIQFNKQLAKYRLEHAKQSLMKAKHAKHFSTIERLLLYIKPMLKKQRYQIQQGISLIHADNKPTDFRVLVQKNGLGQWTVTSIVARTAAANIFVSNLATGGSISTVSQILPNTSLNTKYTTDTLTHELKRAALLIARTFEMHCDVVLGELGIDLALDEQGKIWLLEINGKPSKLTTAKRQTVRIRPSVRLLIAYSLFLSEFNQGGQVK